MHVGVAVPALGAPVIVTHMQTLGCRIEQRSMVPVQPRPGASRGIDIARGQSMHPEEDVGIYGRSLAFQGQQPALPMR